MRISYDDNTLLETITFIVPSINTTVVLGEEPELLTFLIQFETSAEKKEPQLSLQTVDKTTGNLIFRDWDNLLGTGLVDPLEIGTFRKRKLYLLPFVRKIGGKGDQRLLTLTFYTGEEVSDGQN